MADRYTFPIRGYTGTVELHWGSVKGGSDLFAAQGSPVVTLASGVVESAGWDDVGGWNVLQRLDTRLYAYYAHMDREPAVRFGQWVPAGTEIAGVGETGNAQGKGAHLHIGIGPEIIHGTGPYGGTGGDFDAVGLLRDALKGTVPPVVTPTGYDEDVALAVMDTATELRLPQLLLLSLAYGEGGLKRPFPVGDDGKSFGPFQVYTTVHGGTRQQWEDAPTAMRYLAVNAPNGGWVKSFAAKGGWPKWWYDHYAFIEKWAPYAQGSDPWDADKARRCVGHGLDTLVLVLKAQKPPPSDDDALGRAVRAELARHGMENVADLGAALDAIKRAVERETELVQKVGG